MQTLLFCNIPVCVLGSVVRPVSIIKPFVRTKSQKMDRCFTILYLFGQNLFRASAGGLKLLSLQRFKTLYSITLASVLYLDFNQISMFSFWLRLGIKPYLFLCCTFLILDLQYGECAVSSGLKTWFLLLLILWFCGCVLCQKYSRKMKTSIMIHLPQIGMCEEEMSIDSM